jgi:hypothetical protein
MEGIPNFYHKIWHPPTKKSVGKYLIPPLKGDEMFRTSPPRAPNQSPSPQFTLTLDFLPSPSTFYPHPRLFTLDFLPSTFYPRPRLTLD